MEYRKNTIITVFVIGVLLSLCIGVLIKVHYSSYSMMQELKKIDIPKQIIGTWEQKWHYAVGGTDIVTRSYYPGGIFRFEDINKDKDKTTEITFEGTYRIVDTKIIHTITTSDRPDINPIGKTFVKSFRKLTQEIFEYSDENGNIGNYKRIK